MFWLLLGALVSLALAETLARAAVRRGRYFVLAPRISEALRPDDDVYADLEPLVNVDTNADGERGRPDGPSEKAFRILVAGGSAAECRLLNWPSTWMGALESLLNSPEALRALGASESYVGSVGQSGRGDARSIFRVLEKILTQYSDLDLLVIMTGAGDMLSWMSLGAGTGATPRALPTRRLFQVHPEHDFGFTPRTLGLTEVFRRLRRRSRPPVRTVGNWMGRARSQRAQATAFIDDVGDPGAMLDQFETALRSIFALANHHGLPVLLVRQPWLTSYPLAPEDHRRMWNCCIGTAYNGQVEGYFSDRVINTVMRHIDEKAAKVATASGVPHVAVTDLIGKRAELFIDRFHLRPGAAPLVAKPIAEKILNTVSGLD